MARITSTLMASIAGLCIVTTAHGEGGFHPPTKMIRLSDFIAIVIIDRVTPLPKTERPRWQFGQRAHAIVERNVKGALPRDIDIYGDENFVCQQTELSPGRYLAFLVRGFSGQLESVNYQMGIRPIRGESVQWYYRAGDPLGPLYGYELRWQRLDSLVRHITSTRRPNQTMQRIASQPATYFQSVCHPPFGCVTRFTGPTVADLESR
jgi:hypothetical protein